MRLGRGSWRVLLGGLLFAGVGIGAGACDDRSDVPADLVHPPDEPKTEQTQTSATSRPTTQVLVESPRTTMTLDVLPLTLAVPPHWKITRRSTSNLPLVWLEGPAPAGDVQIALKVQEPMIPQKFEQLLLGAGRAEVLSAEQTEAALLRFAAGVAVLQSGAVAGAALGATAARAVTSPWARRRVSPKWLARGFVGARAVTGHGGWTPLLCAGCGAIETFWPLGIVPSANASQGSRASTCIHRAD